MMVRVVYMVVVVMRPKVYLVVIGQRFRKQKKVQLLKRGGGEAVISKEQMFFHIEADGCEVV